MALTLITLCSVLISCYVSTPPAGGVCCSNHPQLCASVSKFWTFAILWKLPPFFLSCANTVQWLISSWILGAHLFQTVQWQPNHVEKIQRRQSHPLPSPCSSSQNAALSWKGCCSYLHPGGNNLLYWGATASFGLDRQLHPSKCSSVTSKEVFRLS